MKAEEKIFGGPWEGLCLIENYDGAFYGDPERDVMQPTATVSADDMAGWPSKYNAFRIHDDGTIDVVFYYSTAYTSMLRHCAWEIYRMAEGLSAWPRDKWIECPNMSLIPQNSAQQHYQIMVSEMQRFAGIDLTQFVTLDPDIHAEPKPGRSAPVGGMWYKPEKTTKTVQGQRTIKFRAKTNDLLSHGTWVYGFYVEKPIPVIDLKSMKQTGERPGGYIITDKDGESNLKKRQVYPSTVGQYTGLKDKNGREIYEGDILASGNARHLVEYQDAEGGFMGVNPNYGKDALSEADFSTPLRQWWLTKFGKEVIGNIHDNPELLSE